MPPDMNPALGEPRFPLGRLVATPAALTTLVVAKVSPWRLLARHARGDWGDLGEHDCKENDRALEAGTRLLSSYALPGGEKVWVIVRRDKHGSIPV